MHMHKGLWGIFSGIALFFLWPVDATGQSSQSVEKKQVPPSRIKPNRKLYVEAQEGVTIEWLKKLQAGLPPVERNAVKWNLSSNGRTDGRQRYTLDVDCAYRSGSEGLKMLHHLACTSERSTVIHIDEPRQTFESRIGVASETGAAVVRFEDKFGVKNYVGDGVPGQFLTPLNGSPVPDDIYSVSGDAEIHIQRDLPLAEAVATAYHEIYHAFVWSMGRLWRHGEPGVNKAIQRVERESRENSTK